MSRYICGICGYVYDETKGDTDNGIPPGTKWEELPDDWACPMCTAPKAIFEKEKGKNAPEPEKTVKPATKVKAPENPKFSFSEIGALCSNLSKGCEKQFRMEESDLFRQLAEYFDSKADLPGNREFDDIGNLIEGDLREGFADTMSVVKENGDRGSLRALVWSEKVTKILKTILMRYKKNGDSLLENTKIHVCEICGFVYIGEEPPVVCPVCKVPKFKIAQVRRR